MPRNWVIAPIESKPPELFDKVWQFDLTNNLISIGWKGLADVSKMNREELAIAVALTYKDKPPTTRSLFANMLWAFYHEICPGDFIIARRGRKILAGLGQVSRAAFYAPGKSSIHSHPNFLEVSWHPSPRDKVYSSVVFPMHTLSELSDEQFRILVERSGEQPLLPETPASEVLEDPKAFYLEKYLEDFIVTNFPAIFKGDLAIYEDAEGNDGQQYSTEIGPIDILSVEPKSNAFVVIELKKGRSSDHVIGQILRYMGWVKQNLCVSGQTVKGLIICSESDPKLSYALEMTSNIDVRYYSVYFKLSAVPQKKS